MSNTSQKVLPSCISLPLDPEVLDEIVTKAKDYALMHGICMRPKATFSPDSLSVSRWNSRSRRWRHDSHQSRFFMLTQRFISISVRSICTYAIVISAFRVREGHQLANSVERANSQCCARLWISSRNSRQHHQSRWLYRIFVQNLRNSIVWGSHSGKLIFHSFLWIGRGSLQDDPWCFSTFSRQNKNFMFLGSLSGTDSLRHDAWDKQVVLHKAVWTYRQALLLLRRDGRNKHDRIGIWTLGSDVEVAPKVHDKIQFSVLPFFLSNDVHTKKNPVFFYFLRVLFQVVFHFCWGSSSPCDQSQTQPHPAVSLLSNIFSPIFCQFQTITLGLLRSDYFNSDRNKILQVEFNTIASSFGGISGKFRHFHR